MARPKKENGHPDIYKDGHIDIAHPLAKKWRSYRLSGEEWQILWVIMEKTWGWHKAWGNIFLKQFYIETEIKKPNIIRAINKLISKNIVIKKDNKDDGKLSEYHINSHFEQWKNIIKKDNKKTLSKMITSVIKNDNVSLSKKITSVIKNDNEKISKQLSNKDLPDTKETIKEIYKETNKEKGDNFIKVWKDFIEMRVKIRKPMTLRAEELVIKELDKLSCNVTEQIKILEQSIMNSWQGVFPLKNKDTPKKMMGIDEALKIVNGKEVK